MSTFTISAFYNRKSWNILMKEFLWSFTKTLSDEKQIDFFSIFFSAIQGDHISLQISCRSEDVTFQSDCLERLAAYLKENPSSMEPGHPSVHSIFMDYPNNCAFLNVDALPRFYSAEYGYTSLRQKMSTAMLSFFSHNACTVENFYLFLFCIQIVEAKKQYQNFNAARKVRSESDPKHKDLAAFFDKNRMLITKVVQDVWGLDRSHASIPWMHEIYQFYNGFVQQNNIGDYSACCLKLFTEHLSVSLEEASSISREFFQYTFAKMN